MSRKKHEGLELVDILRKAIISGELKPLERLIEADLAKKYEVSRTPVREAIKHLEALGLVTTVRHKGAMVSDIDPVEIREMQVVRASLEGLAASLAATRMTEEELLRLESFAQEMKLAVEEKDIQRFTKYNELFHQLFYQASDNQFLFETIRNLLQRTWHEPINSWRGLIDIDHTMRGHQCILQALKEKDPEKARTAAQQHILDAMNMRYYVQSNRKNSQDLRIT